MGGMHGGGVCGRGMHGRGHAWQVRIDDRGAWVLEAMCGRGTCMVGGHAWQGGMCGRVGVWQVGMHGRAWVLGACVAGDMHGRGHVWQGACMAGEVCVAGGSCVVGGHAPLLDTMRYSQ